MFKPRWYQEEAENAIVNYFYNNNGNPVVVMPTGTGKSIVIASFIKNCLYYFPDQRLMMLTHVKELIEQNAEKVLKMWANAPLGVYSAGLKSRDMNLPIIFGGVQSVANAIKRWESLPDNEKVYNNHFGFRDLLIVDECHLISEEESALYNYVIAELMKINPYLKVIGFTATHYRLKTGLLTEGGIFTDICYDISGINSFNRLIEDGFLSMLVARPTETEVDFNDVRIINGEFNAKQADAKLTDEIIEKAIHEMLYWGQYRNSWLTFTSGVNGAETIAAALNSYGIESACVHSKLKSAENDYRIRAFKNGDLRALVNCNKLTTGFDHPPIDLIGMFKPTTSASLWVQMLGRGTRPYPNKRDCLVLDFAGNTPRLGPINDPIIPTRRGKGTGDAPIRICRTEDGGCGNYCHASARFCTYCGKEFTFETKLFAKAGTKALVKSKEDEKEVIIEYFKVYKVIYNLHEKRDRNGNMLSPPMIKVTYFAGDRQFNEFVMLEHSGRTLHRSREWWRLRHSEEPPLTTYEALQKTSVLKIPYGINVRLDEKYPEIISLEW